MQDSLFTKADNDGLVEVAPGSVSTIELEENPTTGYQWAVEDPLPPGVSLVDSEYTPRNRAIGAGGLRRFRFRADQPGVGMLSLKLWRQWQGDASVTERFRVTVRVSGA